MSSNTSQSFFAMQRNLTVNEKGADAFISTGNPILDLFTETRKKVPDNLEDFTALVRKIEIAKNFDTEMFVKMLKFHRLIEKGNGMKGIYYICMMVLKDDDPILYEQIIKWSYQYPKDILRLSRISSMFGGNCIKGSGNSNVYGDLPEVSFPKSILKYSEKGISKGDLGTRMTKWAKSNYERTASTSFEAISGLVPSSFVSIPISAEIELYAQQIVYIIKKILLGKLFDDDVNLMFFKYLSYETGHFAVESKVIWKRVSDLLFLEPIYRTAFTEYSMMNSV